MGTLWVDDDNMNYNIEVKMNLLFKDILFELDDETFKALEESILSEGIRDALAVWIGDEQCAANGVPHVGYDEARATEHLRRPEVTITVDVGVGESSATIWTRKPIPL